METRLAVTSLEGLVLYFESVCLLWLYYLTIFLSTLCIAPSFISCHYVYYHMEKFGPSIIVKRISSKKRLVWNLLHLWRSEQSCSAGGLGKMKSLFNLSATYGAAADSLPPALIVSVGWAPGINRPQSPVCLEHAQLNVKSLTKAALHSNLVNHHSASKSLGFLLFFIFFFSQELRCNFSSWAAMLLK